MLHHRASRALVLALALAGLPSCVSDPTVITETHTVGTFNLAALGTSASENEGISVSVPRPAGDIMVRSMKFFVTDAGGRQLSLDDGIHLHHVVLMSSKTTDSSCPTTGYPAIGGQRFAASGNEKSPIVLPPGHGYHARAGDSWRAIWHIMNMGATAQSGVRLGYEISYLRGGPGAGMRDVTPWYLDVAGCNRADYDLPGGGAPGSVAATSADFALPAGRSVFALGHLHDGGIDVSLTDPGGVARCTSRAVYGEGHDHSGTAPAHIEAMPICVQQFDIGAGTWKVTARYPGDVAYKDVMGVIFTYIAQ